MNSFRSYSKIVLRLAALWILTGAIPFYTFHATGVALAEELSSRVLQSEHADVTGDGIPETIKLIGTQSDADPERYSKLSIEVQDGAYQKLTIFYVEHGYNPLLQVCDLDGDEVNDLFFTVWDPADRSKPVYAKFSLNGESSTLSSQPLLPQPLSVNGKLKDNYKAQIRMQNTNQSYVLDLQERRLTYEQAGVYQNSRLLEPRGLEAAAAFNELVPIDFDKDGTYELRGVQRVSGITTDDVLAYAVSIWKYRYDQWTLMHTELILPQ